MAWMKNNMKNVWTTTTRVSYEKSFKMVSISFLKRDETKVMIMSAFLVEPSLYIVDEPFVGLDPLAIQSLLQMMDQMKRVVPVF